MSLYPVLYKRAEIPITLSSDRIIDSDGVNIIICTTVNGAGNREIILTFRKCTAKSNFRLIETMFSIITDWRYSTGILVYYTDPMSDQTYVILGRYHVGEIMLFSEGKMIDSRNSGRAININRGYDRDNGYLSNIIGFEIDGDNTINEYSIDTITNKFQTKSYTFIDNAWNVNHILLNRLSVCSMNTASINIIDRSSGESRCFSYGELGMESFGVKLVSCDEKYITSQIDRTTVSIYDARTFDVIARNVQYGNDILPYNIGSVDGYAILLSRSMVSPPGLGYKISAIKGDCVYTIIINQMIYLPSCGLFYERSRSADRGEADLFGFKWDWRNFRLQCPDVQQRIMMIYWVLRKCEIDKNIAMKIVGMAV